MLSKKSIVALPLVLALVGCGGALTPRTSHPLKWKEWTDIGAMLDASKGYPIAFWANPNRKPKTVEVNGDTFAVGQWMIHLARSLNVTLGQKSLYDDRFRGFAPQLFAWELDAGRVVYKWQTKPDETAAQVQRTGARALEVRFVSAKHAALAGESGVRILISVILPSGATRSYTAESSNPSYWDAECMNTVAKKILGDADLWRAVKGG